VHENGSEKPPSVTKLGIPANSNSTVADPPGAKWTRKVAGEAVTENVPLAEAY